MLWTKQFKNDKFLVVDIPIQKDKQNKASGFTSPHFITIIKCDLISYWEMMNLQKKYCRSDIVNFNNFMQLLILANYIIILFLIYVTN